MSMLKGLESFRARMEEEGTTEETSVDVEVRVAEEVEAATQIVEEATSIVEVAEQSDEVEETVESLEAWKASIEKYGLSQQGLDLMNMNGTLAAFSGMAIPATESLDSVGRNHEAAQMVIAAIEGTISNAWESVKKFFRNIWEKIKAMVAWVMNKVVSQSKAVENAYEAIKNITLDTEKYDKKEIKIISFDQTKQIASSVAFVEPVLKAMNANMSAGNVQANLLDKDRANLEGLGLTVKDGSIEVDKDTFKTESKNMKETGWTIEVCKGDGHTVAKTVCDKLKQIQALSKNIENICKAGEAAVDSKAEGSKEKIASIRKAASTTSKLISKFVSRGQMVPSAYVSACGAIRSCAK